MPRRRRLLRWGVTALAAGLGGCSEGTVPAGFESDDRTGTPTTPAVLATAPLRTPTGTATGTGDRERVVVAADLPPAEYEIAATVVADGAYRTCHPSDAFDSLTRRFGYESYLRFEGALYGIWLAAGDEVQINTGDAGATLPEC